MHDNMTLVDPLKSRIKLSGYLFRPECCPNSVFFSELPPILTKKPPVSNPGDLTNQASVATLAALRVPYKVSSHLRLSVFQDRFPDLELPELGKVYRVFLETYDFRRGEYCCSLLS